MQIKHWYPKVYLYIYIYIYIYRLTERVEWCKCHLCAFKHLFRSSEAELIANDMFLARFENRLPCKSITKDHQRIQKAVAHERTHTHHQRSRRYAEPYVPAPGRVGGLGTQILNPRQGPSHKTCGHDGHVFDLLSVDKRQKCSV